MFLVNGSNDNDILHVMFVFQLRIVNDLRNLGAKQALIDEQVQQIHAIENNLSLLFRQTVRNKLRRKSTIKQDSMVNW